MTIPFREVLRIAFRAEVAPSTVRAYFEGGRRQHPKTVRAIEAVLAEDAALAKAVVTPVCPHEP